MLGVGDLLLVIIDKSAGDVGACAHISFILWWQLDVLGKTLLVLASLGHRHGRHDGQLPLAGRDVVVVTKYLVVIVERDSANGKRH